MTISAYNTENPIKATKEVILGKDTYTLEVRKLSYHILINGREDKVYTRLPKELKEWFGA